MATKTYAFNKVSCSLGGILITGFMEDTVITVTRDEDSFEKHTGADGEVSRAANANKGGTATLRLKQTSLSNDMLSNRLAADELSNTGVGVFNVTDAGGRTNVNAAEAWIKKPAEVTFAKGVEGREWTIDLANVDMFIGGN